MKNIFVLISIICASLFFSCAPSISGNVDETNTGFAASLVNEDGAAVPYASVRIYSYRDSTGIWLDSISTDSNGNYSLETLKSGRYSIWAETDTSIMFRENIVISEEVPFLETDTLNRPNNVAVPVKVQPNHDPRTVEVQIWGTPIRHNVTKEGYLLLDKIAAGTYFTRLTSTLEGYSATNTELLIPSNSPDTLTDTLELIYTGIPVVEGFLSDYDTLNRVVNLSWEQSEFFNIQAYVIERKEKSSTLWPDSAVAHIYVSEQSHIASYSDTLDSDAADSEYQYRIRIIDNGGRSGDPFGVIEVDIVSQETVETSVSLESVHVTLGESTQSTSVNDDVLLTAKFSNPTRNLTEIKWFDGDELFKSKVLTADDVTDSCTKSWGSTGIRKLRVEITDAARHKWNSTIEIDVVDDIPVVNFVDTTIKLKVLDTLKLDVSDKFGKIISYEWDWGNDGSVDGTEPYFVDSTTQFIHDLPCKVTVTDDDNNRVEKLFTVTSELVWDKYARLPEELRRRRTNSYFSVNGKLIITNYQKGFGQYGESECWISEDDGLSWEKLPNNLPLRVDNIVYHQDNYFVQVSDSVSMLWSVGIVELLKSSDLTDWQTVLDRRQMINPLSGLILYDRDDKIYCNYFDTTSIEDTAGVFFESDDMGLTWKSAGFPEKLYLPYYPAARGGRLFNSDNITAITWDDFYWDEQQFSVSKYDYSWNKYDSTLYEYQRKDSEYYNFSAVPYEGSMLYIPHEVVYFAADSGLKAVSEIPIHDKYHQVRVLLHNDDIYAISDMDIYRIR